MTNSADGTRKTGNLPGVEVPGMNHTGNGPCPDCVALRAQGFGACRRHRRRSDVPAARGSRQHRSGAAHFLRETVSRVRYAGAQGQLTVRADSGFYTHSVVSVCRKMDLRFSITIRQHQSLHNVIEAIPEEDWTPIPYWMDGAADVAETTYRACLNKLGVMRNWKA